MSLKKTAHTDKPFSTPIKSITRETPDSITIFVNFVIDGKKPIIKPGQFIMVWIPGIDEVPMAVSYALENGDIGFTVKDVGEATHSLHNLEIGDIIGIRGPYGNGYQVREGYSVIVGGGIGMASVKLLIDLVQKKMTHHYSVIVGARTKKELLYLPELEKNCPKSQLFVCTDDGSYENKGFVTELLKEILPWIKERSGAQKITIYACGPEIMLKKILLFCNSNNIELEASLERYMRCGFGLCGLCIVDPLGIKICQNGPVLTSAILNELDDFGRFHRDETGEKIRIDSHYE
ncbi:MAG: dihydroorotate dehydrogenase electron transfer subunit [Candidatus Lokiarchaeota archaeon]|nr:dihydroorotate dehydrogenase electron transfer subunit [Candidatus Lokiarchaeota archaeon]